MVVAVVVVFGIKILFKMAKTREAINFTRTLDKKEPRKSL